MPNINQNMILNIEKRNANKFEIDDSKEKSSVEKIDIQNENHPSVGTISIAGGVAGASLGVSSGIACIAGAYVACPIAFLANVLATAFLIGGIISTIVLKNRIESKDKLSDTPTNKFPGEFSAEFEWNGEKFSISDREGLVKRSNLKISEEISQLLNKQTIISEEKPIKIFAYEKEDIIIIETKFMEKSQDDLLIPYFFNSSDNPENIQSLFFHFKHQDFKKLSISNHIKNQISHDVFTKAIKDSISPDKSKTICAKIPIVNENPITVQFELNQEQQNSSLCF